MKGRKDDDARAISEVQLRTAANHSGASGANRRAHHRYRRAGGGSKTVQDPERLVLHGAGLGRDGG